MNPNEASLLHLHSYRVAEFATLDRSGSPVCWPLAPDFERDHIIFSTGYMYPTKAHNARRNPRVAALFSDPTASGQPDDGLQALVQGSAEVIDQDLQQNTERYVDQLLRKGPFMLRVILRTPGLRQIMVGYVARIWIEMLPRHEYVWTPNQRLSEPLRTAICPDSFTPGAGIRIPKQVFEWLPRYRRPPVLAYINRSGWPVLMRVNVSMLPEHISIESDIDMHEGAPACLTYHRLVGNYQANDTFLIRGHFDRARKLIPEKVVGFAGTVDDRGLGSLKLIRMILDYRKQLSLRMEKEGRPLPVVRPTPGG